MKLVRVEPGEFRMGQGEAPPTTRDEWNTRDWDESPAHTVKLTQPFYVGVTEVTNAQYEQFDPEHKKLRDLHGISDLDDQPVVMVSWQQAVDFCDWLAKKEERFLSPPHRSRVGIRLPRRHDDSLPHRREAFAETSKLRPVTQRRSGAEPVPVGSYPPNAWGLCDMHGNVAEWCLDWYGPYAAGEQSDPVGAADGWARITRGWSYLSASHDLGAVRYCRSANRSGQLPEDANRVTGFRVVLGEMPKTTPLPAFAVPRHQQNVQQQPAPTAGPDPREPFFEDITRGLRVPDDAWGPIYGAWNHYSTIAACPNGDVLAVWYTCTQEEGRECAQAASRLRVGSDKWDEPSWFFGVPDCNTHAPVLLSDGRRLYHFFTQSFAGWDDAADCLRTSDDNGASWSKPRIILTREDPRRMSQPCSAIVAKDGKLVLAVDGDFGHRDERVMISADRGATWQVAAGDLRKAAGDYAIHPAVVQRDDGALLAFLRGPDPMPAFVSPDDGRTWEPQKTPFPGISVGQKAAALKLASGALLLCSFDNKKQLAEGGTFAALSLDDGRTWSHLRKIEGPTGYMSLAQGNNGLIYLLGPNGSSIRCAAFNEAWLKQGAAVRQ